ncbi:MAG: hypothetical protein DF168_00109 [Candidatus Moanabacter tarae]|uniref:Protein nucleotidyltransferase YdiU n=1 Tax=Candidatus Moanibacter tarae TaxID=2200854 RepID=A0A2Z4AG99_9BACT|nr:MAG: hypothetical protein DF168_00109 [Candidatus Moanabacter tarae]|tara:strand:- start:39977 stop:41419 length:1443 start_codon:yes stop_codon:yes gene_type:complete
MILPFDNSYARLPERLFERTEPAKVPNPNLIRLNRELAATLSLDPDWLESDEGIAMLAGNSIPQGADPLAQAYAGHQFGGFVPQLGDGRAILLGEIHGVDGVLRDMQLKGSGRTRFSRNGDGKSALGPVLREYLVSEAMHALGIPTTRALAAVSTGETVEREMRLPGGVFTRIAASHLRIGTFQYFQARNDIDAVRLLADYAIARHYPEALGANNPYLSFLEAVITTQSKLIARWMSVGFIHGVMNTDNTAISGETIDFGPCAFMEAFYPGCVFSSIDRNSRYAWGNQPAIAQWNLARFAESILGLLDANGSEATKMAEKALVAFSGQVQRHLSKTFRAKLGLRNDEDSFITETLKTLEDQKVDFTLFFRHLTLVAAGDNPETLAALFKTRPDFESWLTKWKNLADPVNCLTHMRANNPILIPRNHRVEQAIQKAYSGNFAPFHRIVDALAHPYVEQPDYADLETPPKPEEIVHHTFCGT